MIDLLKIIIRLSAFFGLILSSTAYADVATDQRDAREIVADTIASGATLLRLVGQNELTALPKQVVNAKQVWFWSYRRIN